MSITKGKKLLTITKETTKTKNMNEIGFFDI